MNGSTMDKYRVENTSINKNNSTDVENQVEHTNTKTEGKLPVKGCTNTLTESTTL